MNNSQAVNRIFFSLKATNKTKQTNKTNDNFSTKKSISETNVTKSEGRVRFGHIFFENDPLDESKKMTPSKKLYLFSILVKNAAQNGDQNRFYPSLTIMTIRLQNVSL